MMKPTQKSLKPHINAWIEGNLITQEQGEGILAKYPTSSTSPATMTFSIIGGMLCILGVILLVSANWQSIPREVKLGALLGLLTASTLLGTEGSRRKWHPAIPEISYLFAAVLPPNRASPRQSNLQSWRFRLRAYTHLAHLHSLSSIPVIQPVHIRCLDDLSVCLGSVSHNRVPLGMVQR